MGFISTSLSLSNTASFQEMLQRWRAVGYAVSDLSDPRCEPYTSRYKDECVIFKFQSYQDNSQFILIELDWKWFKFKSKRLALYNWFIFFVKAYQNFVKMHKSVLWRNTSQFSKILSCNNWQQFVCVRKGTIKSLRCLSKFLTKQNVKKKFWKPVK